MATPLPSLQPRGIDSNLPTCGEVQCNSQGLCVPDPEGGVHQVCDCYLGYHGDSCEDTVNGALSVPLTLTVVFIILGILLIAFIFAKLRQRQKKNKRRRLQAARHGYNIAV